MGRRRHRREWTVNRSARAWPHSMLSCSLQPQALLWAGCLLPMRTRCAAHDELEITTGALGPVAVKLLSRCDDLMHRTLPVQITIRRRAEHEMAAGPGWWESQLRWCGGKRQVQSSCGRWSGPAKLAQRQWQWGACCGTSVGTAAGYEKSQHACPDREWAHNFAATRGGGSGYACAGCAWATLLGRHQGSARWCSGDTSIAAPLLRRRLGRAYAAGRSTRPEQWWRTPPGGPLRPPCLQQQTVSSGEAVSAPVLWSRKRLAVAAMLCS